MSYWANRTQAKYYQKALSFARSYARNGGSIIDVGCADCEYITWFTWFNTKYTIDLRHRRKLRGVIDITGNFMDCDLGSFDLALCLQVIEHLSDPVSFCRKLFKIGQVVIISVPYKWSYGYGQYGHLQDPIDMPKLLSWTKYKPKDYSIIKDRMERLVAVFDNRVKIF